MPRKPQPWFRFYVETAGDPKVRRIPFERRWLWACVMSAARESPRPGSLYIAENVPMTFQELADYAGCPLKIIAPTIELMTTLGMVATVDGAIRVVNFASRQFESDNVTARTQAHRERSKERSEERSTEPRRNVRRNTPETETETDNKASNSISEGRAPTSPRDPTDPPTQTPFCEQHPNGTDEPCARCGDARRRYDAHESSELTRRLNEAIAAKTTRDQCTRCDENGFVLDPTTAAPIARCDHAPIGADA